MTFTKLSLITAIALSLAACASGPSDNISLVDNQINQESSKSGSFTQPFKIDETRPGCSGECPHLVVDSLVFPGNAKLTQLVDHTLASMSWIDEDQPAPYDNIAGLEKYYWKTAADRDEMYLIAKTKFRNKYLTTIDLSAYQYRTGMAHGMGGSQFINWDNQTAKNLSLDDLLQAGAHDKYVEQLKIVYGKWLKDNSASIDDPENYLRMWPFVATDNAGLTDAGLLVKYQPYEIAPYSSGQPEMLIPYKDLKGILKSKFIPK